MKKLCLMVCALFLVVGLTIVPSSILAQDPGTEESRGSEASPPSDEPAATEENPAPEETSAAEAKTYVCPQCGYSSDSPEGCPACNVPLVEQTGGSEPDPASDADDDGPPRDDEVTDEESVDEEPKDEEPKDEEPKDEE